MGQEAIRKKEMELAELFVRMVREISGIRIYGDFSTSLRAPIVTLNLKGVQAALLADILWTEYETAVRAGAHCAPRMHRALGTGEAGAVRFSFSWFNTEEEAVAAARALGEISREGC